MATNRRRVAGRKLSLTASHPTTPASGNPVRVGEMVGVAITDEQADGTTSIDFGGVYDLAVGGVDGGGNSAVAVGDRLYYTDADTPVINKKNTGRPVGFALGTVTSGGTATIPVKLHAF